MKIETAPFHFPASFANRTPPPPPADGESEFAAFAAQFANRAERLRQARIAEPPRHVPEAVTDAQTRHTAEMWAGGLLLVGLAVAVLFVWGWPVQLVTGSPADAGITQPAEIAAAPPTEPQTAATVASPAISAPLPPTEPSPPASAPAAALPTPQEAAATSPTTTPDTAPSAPAVVPTTTVANLIQAATPPPTTPVKAAAVSAPLNWGDARELQTRLKGAGFDPGPIDGIVGPLTTDAARRYGEARALASKDPASGMLVRLRSEPAQSAENPPR
jgi:hypothetical protein